MTLTDSTILQKGRSRKNTVGRVIPWWVFDHTFSRSTRPQGYRRSSNSPPALESFVSDGISWWKAKIKSLILLFSLKFIEMGVEWILPSLGAMTVGGGWGFPGGEGGVVTPFAVGWGERRLPGGEDGGADLAVGDASVGRDGGHEGGGGGGDGRGDGKGGVFGLGVLRDREIRGRRVGIWNWLDLRVCKMKSGFLSVRLRWRRKRGGGRGMGRCATKASVTGAIQQVDDLFELGDSEVGDFRAVKVVEIKTAVVCGRRGGGGRRRRDLRGKDTNEMLHAFQPSGSCFFNGCLFFHPNLGKGFKI